MTELPPKHRQLLRWLVVDLETRKFMMEDGTNIRAFTGHQAIDSLVKSPSPIIRKEIGNEENAKKYLEILVENDIIVRAEEVRVRKQGYRLKKHARQIFTEKDKFYWESTYAPFMPVLVVLGVFALICSAIFLYMRPTHVEKTDENEWNVQDEFWAGL